MGGVVIKGGDRGTLPKQETLRRARWTCTVACGGLEVDKDVDEEVDMHSCLRWWTRMWMIQIADLTVKKYKMTKKTLL